VNVFVGLVILAALVAGLMFIQKMIGIGMGKATSALGQKVFFRAEHEEDEKLLEPYAFRTSAPMDRIRLSLRYHIKPSEKKVGVAAAIHELSCTGDGIAFGLASSLSGTTFTVLINVNDHVQPTQGVLHVVNYKESDGLIVGRDMLRTLRHQIRTALSSVDPDVVIESGAPGTEMQYKTKWV